MLRKGYGGLYKPQQGKKKKVKRLRWEGDQIKFIDLRFGRSQVLSFRKARRRQDVRYQDLHIENNEH